MNKRHSLDILGRKISKIDISLMALLKRRSELTRQVALFKIQNGKKFVRLNIEKERINAVRKWAKQHGMDPNFAQQILYSVINESCKQQLVEVQNIISLQK